MKEKAIYNICCSDDLRAVANKYRKVKEWLLEHDNFLYDKFESGQITNCIIVFQSDGMITWGPITKSITLETYIGRWNYDVIKFDPIERKLREFLEIL